MVHGARPEDASWFSGFLQDYGWLSSPCRGQNDCNAIIVIIAVKLFNPTSCERLDGPHLRVQKTGKLKYDTDLLIDQVRAISVRRLMYCCCALGANRLNKVEEALRLLTGR